MNLLFRRLLTILSDAALIILSLYLAYSVRFDFDIPASPYDYLGHVKSLLLSTLVIRILFFYVFGLYRGVLRYTSIADLIAILKAVTLGSLIIVLLNFASHIIPWNITQPPVMEFLARVFNLIYLNSPARVLQIPRSIIFMDWVFNVLFISGSRIMARMLIEWTQTRGGENIKKTLIIGTDDAAETIFREIKKNPELKYYPIGFIDQDGQKAGMRIHGVKILGGIDKIREFVAKLEIDEILVAIPRPSGTLMRSIVEQCTDSRVKLRTIPDVGDIIDGRLKVSKLREVAPEDLLGRETVEIDLTKISAYLQNKVVLVTGAGGSIGSELCRQISSFAPKSLLLMGRGENSIYEINEELISEHTNLNLVPLIGDIQDINRVNQIFNSYQPDVVFHAAAHKHVPLMELNPEEAVKNNITGTINVAMASNRFEVKKFILISTDKAVNPTSVMGTSKRVAELYLQGFSSRSKTKFIIVRFGNVLGSRGSVVPLFQRQIARGGPVTITDRAITRYFMTIPEAVRLVIQTGSMGATGDIFVLDMGEPIKILDFAKQLISLSGYRPFEDIPIEFVGLRPGEKLHEELHSASESVKISEHKKIFVAKHEKVDFDNLVGQIQVLEKYAEEANRSEIISVLKRIIPSFHNF